MITPGFSLTATERVLPRLALDFTTASLDPRVTFTRTGDTATVTNSSGLVAPINANLPRFDFDPITLACKGLLIEEARTNLLTYSEQINNVIWINYGSISVAANATTAPDGNLTADNVIPAASTGTFAFGQTIIKAVSAITYTLSGYSKSAGYDFLIFRIDGLAGDGVKGAFNISTGTISTAFATNGVGWAIGNAAINSVGSGWYRWSVTFTTNTASSLRTIIYVSNVTGDGFSVPPYTANGSSGIYIWGAQLEVGAFGTSYIPTVASTVLRNADQASMTGTNFSDWFNASQGSVLYSASVASTTAGGEIYSISTAALNNQNTFYSNIGATGQFICRSANVTVANLTGGAYTANTIFNICNAYKLDSFAMSLNGGAPITDIAGAIPTTIDRVFIGGNVAGTVTSAKTIRKFFYYPQRLTDAEVQAFAK
jgi:hypothetical protein